MSMIKKMLSTVIATALVLSLCITQFTAEPDSVGSNEEGEPVDRSGQVTHVDIPNGNGTFTTLEGAEAQAWYDEAVAEGEKRRIEDEKLNSIHTEIEIGEPRGITNQFSLQRTIRRPRNGGY